MIKFMDSERRHTRGSSLIFIMISVLLISSMATLWTRYLTQNMRQARLMRTREQAIRLADSGVEAAFAVLRAKSAELASAPLSEIDKPMLIYKISDDGETLELEPSLDLQMPANAEGHCFFAVFKESSDSYRIEALGISRDNRVDEGICEIVATAKQQKKQWKLQGRKVLHGTK
jgi:phage baseplate assembly protein gpV